MVNLTWMIPPEVTVELWRAKVGQDQTLVLSGRKEDLITHLERALALARKVQVNDGRDSHRRQVHRPRPGPLHWDWRCLICGEPVADHPSWWQRFRARRP